MNMKGLRTDLHFESEKEAIHLIIDPGMEMKIYSTVELNTIQAEQSDWLADTDEEIDEQELEAHYSYMEKIQEVPNADSCTDAEPLEQCNTMTDEMCCQ
ncbi:hypothetical protein Tco_0748431 [Tanacetum coccineum]|uniref:Uncharacterized protein n=1 Tax=Tanacetum coccineum TaxID=301880 RepID=A0ABQ4YWJ4_9ASTR